MKKLFSSEWERMWSKKITWICFICIPFILLGTIKYYLGNKAMFTYLMGIIYNIPEYKECILDREYLIGATLGTISNVLLLIKIITITIIMKGIFMYNYKIMVSKMS